MKKTGKRGVPYYKKNLRLDAPPTLRHEATSRRQERHSVRNGLRRYEGRMENIELDD